jgi:putative transcriptional regulator
MAQTYVLKNRVRELRSRLNMRQADLAREVDVTRQTILAIEKGRLNPSVMVSLKIARVLREPVGYIFYLDRGEELVGSVATGYGTGKGLIAESSTLQ